MGKCRIVERTNVDKSVEYVIQQKHWLLRWMWADAWESSSSGACCIDSFTTLEEAQKNLCYFDGSKTVDKVIKQEPFKMGGQTKECERCNQWNCVCPMEYDGTIIYK